MEFSFASRSARGVNCYCPVSLPEFQLSAIGLEQIRYARSRRFSPENDGAGGRLYHQSNGIHHKAPAPGLLSTTRMLETDMMRVNQSVLFTARKKSGFKFYCFARFLLIGESFTNKTARPPTARPCPDRFLSFH